MKTQKKIYSCNEIKIVNAIAVLHKVLCSFLIVHLITGRIPHLYHNFMLKIKNFPFHWFLVFHFHHFINFHHIFPDFFHFFFYKNYNYRLTSTYNCFTLSLNSQLDLSLFILCYLLEESQMRNFFFSFFSFSSFLAKHHEAFCRGKERKENYTKNFFAFFSRSMRHKIFLLSFWLFFF